MSGKKQLGQQRPSDTNNTLLYSPPDYTKATISSVVVCNTSAGIAKFRLFHDEDGVVANETTSLHWDDQVASDSTEVVDVEICMGNPDGSIYVRSDTADALTFTAYGEETEDQQQ